MMRVQIKLVGFCSKLEMFGREMELWAGNWIGGKVMLQFMLATA